MADFNRHVGMTAEEAYTKYQAMINKVARGGKGALKDTNSIGMDDLFQIATIGFLEAYSKYNGENRATFAPFAYKMMKWEVHHTLNKRYGVHFPESFTRIWGIVAKYNITDRNMHILKEKKPAKVSDKVVEVALSWIGRTATTSLDGTVNSNGSEETKEMYEIVVGSLSDESVAVVADFLSTLTEKQNEIVNLLMKEKKQGEIATEVGLSQSQVSRNIKAIQKAWVQYTEEADA